MIELVAATSRRQTTVTSVIPHSFIIVCRWTSVELSTVRPPLIESYSIATPLELHLTTSELWFGQEQEGILP